ncbi:MAG: orotidine-5'-phosphate decarboxylase [Candidatus Sungbacteria bacterium]|nr:orotidine-5'-phosphate decarboxylase [Candidatus Sungbacteria bacterium]
MKSKERLIVALDVDDPTWALELVNWLANEVGMFKVGKQLFTRGGPDLIRSILKQKPVFLDLKFHDIPNTVVKASLEAMRLGVSMFNVHASGGKEMMSASSAALLKEALECNKQAPLALAVTMLTSLDHKKLEEVGLVPAPDVVVKMALAAQECGMGGVVCSPLEVREVRQACNSGFMVVTAGIRPSGSAKNDQERVGTPGMAIENGANYLVVGRPIIEADDPVAAAQNIVEEISFALDKTGR